MIEVPEYVLKALGQVRESGAHNMFDKNNVIRETEKYSYLAFDWLCEHQRAYGQILVALGEWLKAKEEG